MIDRLEKWGVLALALFNVLIGTFYFADEDSIGDLAVKPIADLWPGLFVLSGVLLVAWTRCPRSRPLFALSGAITGGAYFSRAILTVWYLTTSWDDVKDRPWPFFIGFCIWLSFGTLVGILWRRFSRERGSV